MLGVESKMNVSPPLEVARKRQSDEDGISSGRIRRSKPRRMLSCLECHRRKVRCSQEVPSCQKCSRNGIACQYSGRFVVPDHSGFKDQHPEASTASIVTRTGVEFTTSTIGEPRSVLEASWPYLSDSPNDNLPRCRPGTALTSILSRINVHEQCMSSDTAQLLRYFPEKDVADKLLDRYFCSIHPIVSIIDWPWFLSQYQLFWKDTTKSNLPFLLIFYSVCYAASVSAYEELKIDKSKMNTSTYQQLSDQLIEFVSLAEIALAMYHFPRKPTLLGCQAAILLYSVSRSDCVTEDSSGMASLIRAAQLMGLQRDDLKFDEKTLQLRRKVWWQIVYLDVTTSLSSGLPPLIQQRQCTTKMPDEFISTTAGGFRMCHVTVFSNARSSWALVTSQILEEIYDNPNSIVSGEMVQKYIKIIDDLEISVNSRSIRLTDCISYNRSLSPFIKYATSMLGTLEQRARILLHQEVCKRNKKGKNEAMLSSSAISRGDSGIPPSPSFFEGQNHTSNARLTSSVTSSVENASLDYSLSPELVSSSITFLEEFCVYGDSKEFSLFVWETRKFQPLRAILIILHDISKEASRWLDDDGASIDIERDARILCINQAFKILGYMGEQTTPLCVQRWQQVTEIMNDIWRQICLVDKLMKSPDSDPLTPVSKENGDSGPLSDLWCQLSSELRNSELLIEDSWNWEIWDPLSGHYT